jgi:hypothetical protein
VEIEEIDREWGPTAAKWVWSARPRYVFEEDGAERGDLDPVEEVTSEAFGDEVGSWTCHPRTKVGDLAVIYRGEGQADPDYPVLGPKDLRYVCLATSDAFPLADDPLAGEFSKHHGCRYVVVGAFDPPIGINELRADPVTERWPALRAGFVQASMPMSEEIWRRLVEMSDTTPEADRTSQPAPHLTPPQRADLERRLEDWLEAHPEALGRLGLDVSVEQRQMLCTPGHEGSIDLLCLRNDQRSSYVAVELKADEIRRDAVAQVLGYAGWLRSRPEVDRASGLVIGLEPHVQVPWVLDVLPGDLVRVAHWDDLGLPPDLADELGLNR